MNLRFSTTSQGGQFDHRACSVLCACDVDKEHIVAQNLFIEISTGSLPYLLALLTYLLAPHYLLCFARAFRGAHLFARSLFHLLPSSWVSRKFLSIS